MIANYRVQAELSAIDSTYDGKSIVLGTVDGCVSVLAIADPKKSEMKVYLKNLPSRDETASIFSIIIKTNIYIYICILKTKKTLRRKVRLCLTYIFSRRFQIKNTYTHHKNNRN